MEDTIKGKNKIFRVNSDTGWSFVAVAELLNISEHELLEELMGAYVKSVRQGIVDVASKYPEFEERYPFVDSSN